jgi:uncharacterized repeat protein (TIGR01451 family)
MIHGAPDHPQRWTPLLNLLLVLALLLVLVPGAAPVRAAGIIYVNAAATGADTGNSWADAFPTLQSALRIASSGEDIWVAAGVYYPDEGTHQINDSRYSTFELFEGVDVYGGFPTTGDPGLNDRDWETYVTVLSGDIDHETNPDTTTATGIVTDTADIAGTNAYHVVTGANNATLDGVTITAGQANTWGKESGAGMYNDGSSPTIQNSILWDKAGSTDALVFDRLSSPAYHSSLVQNIDLSASNNNLDDTNVGSPFVEEPDPGADATWGTNDDNYGNLRVLASSPVIDAGDDDADLDGSGSGSATISDIDTDLDGYARIVNAVDLGAYEYPLAISKAVNADTPAPGEAIRYTLTVTSGIETSTLLISDTLPSGLTFVPGSLEIDGTEQGDPTLPTLADGVHVLTNTETVVTFRATLDADLVGSTLITNTAAASSDEVATSISSSAAITVAVVPDIAVSITPSTSSATVGDEITYTYRVTNTGNVTLSDVSASDDDLGAVPLTSTSLAPDASTSGELTYTVLETDLPGSLANSVTATGTPPVGDDVSASASAAVALTSLPAIAVSVTPSTSSATVGDEITYTYYVTNTGNVTLSDVSASDDDLGAVPLTSTSLAPDASTSGELTYTVLETDLPGPLANSVTVTGTPPVGDDVSASASAAVALIQTTGSNPPTLTSVLAANVQTRGATLHAAVNPNGIATTVTFAWGTTSGGPYPHTQDATDILSGTQVQTASLSLSGLTPDATYFYIVTVTSTGGSATSSEQSFTTPAVTGGPAYGSTPEAGSTLDVGTVPVGESGTVGLELREVGSAALIVNVAELALSGPDAASFRVEAPPSLPLTIADGADAVTLTVVCTPQRDGTHSATLTLTTNDADQPTASYTLTCAGETSTPANDQGTVLYLPFVAR